MDWLSNGFWLSPFFWGGVYLFGVAVGLLVWAVPGLKAGVMAIPRWVPKAFLVFWLLPPILVPLLPQPRLNWPVPVGWVLGGTMVLLSLITHIRAMREIGPMPALRAKSNLVIGGLYGVVRHPLYLGNIVAAFGWALCFRAVHGLLFGGVVAVSYLALILLEERGLVREYGEEYEEYRRRVRWRLVPWVF